MEELGQSALGQVLDMLKHGHLVGIDPRLQLILKRGGIHAAKYMVDWRPDEAQSETLRKALLDDRGCVAASSRVLRIPLQNALRTRACARTI